MAKQIMTSLIETGKVTRGFLGVVIQDVTPELAAAMGLEGNGGVLISNVGKNTPAGRGGIRQGDVVITFNGRKVKNSNQLRNAVAAVKPGTVVPVELNREGKEMRVSVTIDEQPEDMQAAIGGMTRPEGPGRERGEAPEAELGVSLRPLTPEIAAQLGYEGLSGVVVVEVEPDSPAAEANLRPRALIREVNRRPVPDIATFRRAYAGVPSGKHVLLLVQFGDFTRYVAVKKP